MMDSRFQYFHFPRSLKKEEKVECAPCGRCFAQWLCLEAPPPDLPLLGDPEPSQAPSARGAAEAILDWMETHGGEIRTQGSDANLGNLADSLRWSQAYLATCGRFLVFLRQHGERSPSDPTRFVGINLEL